MVRTVADQISFSMLLLVGGTVTAALVVIRASEGSGRGGQVFARARSLVAALG